MAASRSRLTTLLLDHPLGLRDLAAGRRPRRAGMAEAAGAPRRRGAPFAALPKQGARRREAAHASSVPATFSCSSSSSPAVPPATPSSESEPARRQPRPPPSPPPRTAIDDGVGAAAEPASFFLPPRGFRRWWTAYRASQTRARRTSGEDQLRSEAVESRYVLFPPPIGHRRRVAVCSAEVGAVAPMYRARRRETRPCTRRGHGRRRRASTPASTLARRERRGDGANTAGTRRSAAVLASASHRSSTPTHGTMSGSAYAEVRSAHYAEEDEQEARRLEDQPRRDKPGRPRGRPAHRRPRLGRHGTGTREESRALPPHDAERAPAGDQLATFGRDVNGPRTCSRGRDEPRLAPNGPSIVDALKQRRQRAAPPHQWSDRARLSRPFGSTSNRVASSTPSCGLADVNAALRQRLLSSRRGSATRGGRRRSSGGADVARTATTTGETLAARCAARARSRWCTGGLSAGEMPASTRSRRLLSLRTSQAVRRNGRSTLGRWRQPLGVREDRAHEGCGAGRDGRRRRWRRGT